MTTVGAAIWSVAVRGAFAFLAPAALITDLCWIVTGWMMGDHACCRRLSYLANFCCCLIAYGLVLWRAIWAAWFAFFVAQLPLTTSMTVVIDIGGPVHHLLFAFCRTLFALLLLALSCAMRLTFGILVMTAAAPGCVAVLSVATVLGLHL